MKFKDILFWGFIATWGLFLGDKLKTHITEMGRPIKYSANLSVNIENKFRIASFKTESEGMADLERLAGDSHWEEGYVFLPENNQWIEIGFHEERKKSKNGFAEMSNNSYSPYVKKIMKDNNQIAFYHIHPFKHSEYIERLETINIKYEHDNENPEYIEELYSVLSQVISYKIPSYIDLESMICQSIQFKKIRPDGKISFVMVSYFGIAEYNLTEEGFVFFNNKSKNQIQRWVDKNFIQVIKQNEMQSRISLTSFDEATTTGIDKAQELAMLVSNKYLSVKVN